MYSPIFSTLSRRLDTTACIDFKGHTYAFENSLAATIVVSVKVCVLLFSYLLSTSAESEVRSPGSSESGHCGSMTLLGYVLSINHKLSHPCTFHVFCSVFFIHRKFETSVYFYDFWMARDFFKNY